MQIFYYAGAASDSFSTEAFYAEFCNWAEHELVREFPYHRSVVFSDVALTRFVNIPVDDDVRTCLTDDEENRERIMKFCGELFNRYIDALKRSQPMGITK